MAEKSSIKEIFAGLKRAFTFEPRAWTGAAFCLLAVTALTWFGTMISSSPASAHVWLTTLAAAVLLGLASLLLGNLIVSLLSRFQKIPKLFRWILIGTLFLLFNLLNSMLHNMISIIAVMVFLALTATLLGAGLAPLLAKEILEPAKRRAAWCMLLVGGAGLMSAVLWFAWEGPRYQVHDYAKYLSSVESMALEDPGQAGPYPVLTLTYGSGTDRHRPEYGEEVTIQTETVDISSMVDGWAGIAGWLRSSFWDFNLTNAPLNARVWYPDADGPFPLVLIVHGNHDMDDFSDPGYDYLGELLASRGFIVASVDQNFLNGAGIVEFVFGGLTHENDARGYLLLQHLALWHNWNEEEGHVFSGVVDTDHIALIGHSRGGEAAALAAALNKLPAHPDNAGLRFDFDYNIRAVIAIAPSDGMYRPRKRDIFLENINYLVLQGSADSDVRSFEGSRQYDRVYFTDDQDYFKAAVYVYGANHGQFNTAWGRVDLYSAVWFLNRGDIMPFHQQKTVARVLIGGFLEASLRGGREYEHLFENPLTGRNWLPETVYLSQYQSSRTRLIATYDEDLDLETTTHPGGRLFGANLATWREEALTLGDGRLRDTVSARIGWDEGQKGTGVYSLQLPAGFFPYPSDILTFALANASGGQDPLDFTIEITDQAGQSARLPLSHIMPLQPALPYRMFKPPLLVSFESEPVFATFAVPLADFAARNYAINLATIREVSFIFDRSTRGELFIDDIGFRT